MNLEANLSLTTQIKKENADVEPVSIFDHTPPLFNKIISKLPKKL
jgi:hypothetical protein